MTTSAYDGIVAVTACSSCGKEARMAIRTTRPRRSVLASTIYYDDRTAPRDATRYCRACGIATCTQLISVAVHADKP